MRKILPLLLMVMAFTFMAEQESQAQILSTKLKITVIDPLGNVVEDAKVMLFANKADYLKETNEVQPFKLTNAKGQVTFKKLDPKSYYILVKKGDMSNSGGGEIVDTLEKGKLNKANVVISDGL